MRRLLALGLVVLAACTTSPEPEAFDRSDLPRLVLSAEEAPTGTTLIDSASGFITLEALAEDEGEARAFRDAGFQAAYLTFFFDQRLRADDGLDPDASEAVSFALLFDDTDGALEGLGVIEADVRADGSDLEERSTRGLGDAFGLYGQLDPNEPPGFVFAWRVANVVQVIVASGAPGAIREDAVRTLVDLVRTRAFEPA